MSCGDRATVSADGDLVVPLRFRHGASRSVGDSMQLHQQPPVPSSEASQMLSDDDVAVGRAARNWKLRSWEEYGVEGVLEIQPGQPSRPTPWWHCYADSVGRSSGQCRRDAPRPWPPVAMIRSTLVIRALRCLVDLGSCKPRNLIEVFRGRRDADPHASA